VALAYAKAKGDDATKAHSDLLEQLSEDGAMLKQRDRDRCVVLGWCGVVWCGVV
jgi:hypothetical protein